MTEDSEIIIRRAYAEASLAAREKGLSGLKAANAVLAAAAKVSSRILGKTITTADVQSVMRS
ncbi:MAG: hypothetical protein AB7D00_04745 [Rhodospirillaceae bacterium]